jgi:DNA-binding MarR family transcriptional regulator
MAEGVRSIAEPLTVRFRAHIVHVMNNSSSEPSYAASQTDTAEELLEQLDGVLHRFGRLMASRQAQYSRDTGLPAPQYMVLRILLQEGEMRVSDIASTLGVKNPAASGLVQCLEDEGMVARRHDSTDHRVVLVSVTDLGRQRFDTADEHRRMTLRLLTQGLPTSDIRTLVRVMNHMADVVSSEADRLTTTT